MEKASDIAEEYYAQLTLDRSAKKHLGMLSKEGGVEIETVAEENPDASPRSGSTWSSVSTRPPASLPLLLRICPGRG